MDSAISGVHPSPGPSSPTRESKTEPKPSSSALANRSTTTLTLRDRAMDEDQVLQRSGRPLPSSSAPASRPPTRHGSRGDDVMPRVSPSGKPAMFGSTSRKKGMNEAMARLNQSAHQSRVPTPIPTPTLADKKKKKKKAASLLNVFRLPFESTLPNPARSAEYQRIHAALASYRRQAQQQQAQKSVPLQNFEEKKEHVAAQLWKGRPLLPPISELPELLQEADVACRRASGASKYWKDDVDRDLWQRVLVAKLVRAKYAQLDETQGPLLRCARRAAGLEPAELWYRLWEVRAAQQKERANMDKDYKLRYKKRVKEEKQKKKLREKIRAEEVKYWKQYEKEERERLEELRQISRSRMEARERDKAKNQAYGFLAAMEEPYLSMSSWGHP
ncbi:hypothetical protein F4781DRAFT_440790 [Annulohypoxylon bovei var. microspora]|nr:hypothetical protein F4781DRAFT_440790 [Annulohypoxylon bovei var. microspora]